MADTYPNLRSRVGGSGFTIWFWDSVRILFAQQVSDQSPQPVGPATPIHPLDEPYSVEIITAAAGDVGTLTLRLFERYTQKAWDQLGQGGPNALAGTTDVVDVLITIASSSTPLTITKVIAPPKIGGQVIAPYYEQYHKCVVAAVADSETVETGTMQILKDMTINYSYKTNSRNSGNPNSGLGYALRNRPISSTG